MNVSIRSKEYNLEITVWINYGDICDICFASTGRSVPEVMFNRIMKNEKDVAAIYQEVNDFAYES